MGQATTFANALATAPLPQNSTSVPLRESSPSPNGRIGNSRDYGHESCSQFENDHWEDETTIPCHPEGGSCERHEARRCRPSPGSRT
jgi:hypothetical protein